MANSFWISILSASIALIVLVALAMIVYYFVNLKGMKKRRGHFETLHQSLQKGQQVIFSNGLYGEVSAVRDETVDIKVKSGAIITVSRFAISEIIK
ncbi:hypothetical protein BW727_101404 [Jeotgalibaca dankookensis]|uniref:Preprotein translocase subunit YajC n=1 Tax=Jeotgalibaca dankookensis TaxID=708126 RepID=A0A1S6IQE4_9LACT|nr:preprotein translocase subunit YajC [Jeotgalibaca dankookensis]AQS53771.1 hypothetical protein BW727_101404 [Jeotgalibaca dankookensis]